MKKFLFIAFLFIASFTCFSQRIYFCKNYTDTGEPVSSGSVWTINSSGGNVYILFQNGGRPLNVSTVTYYIDKLSGASNYLAFDSKYPAADPNKTWNVLDYKFTTEGDYRIKVLVNFVEVATEYITIKSNGTSTASGSSSSDIYSGSAVSTGTDIDLSSGYVYGPGSTFTMNSQGYGRVYFKVSNGSNKLSTTKLIVDMWKMNSSGTYDFYITKNYDISDLNWVYFSYDYYSSGSYKISVYNGASKWINTAYITIQSSTGGTANTASGNSGVSNDYYTGSSITAGTDIDMSSGYVYGTGGTFKRKSLVNRKINVYFKVSNGIKSINTSKLIVDLWKKNRSGGYDVYKTINFDIKNSSLDWVYFTYEFSDDGDYKVMVYNANSIWINTAYISVD